MPIRREDPTIPPFEENGYLPAGIHPAIFGEIEDRFGSGSELRRVQAESLRWLIGLAEEAGIERIVVDGSFVTDRIDPNDVDCVVRVGPDFSRETRAARELLDGLPFLDIQLVVASEFDIFVEQIFATDRDGVAKGMIEVIL